MARASPGGVMLLPMLVSPRSLVLVGLALGLLSACAETPKPDPSSATPAPPSSSAAAKPITPPPPSTPTPPPSPPPT